VADVIPLPHPAPRRGDLAAAAAAFLEHADLAATTRRVYRASLAALVDGLGATQPLSDQTGELLERWFRTRYGAVAPATWNRELATLRTAVAWWRTHGWPAADPTSGLARRREHPDRTRALTRAQLEVLWRLDDLRLRDKALWRLLYETAARASEALNLDVTDLDLANKRARVVSKGGAVEWIHWQTGTARLLARLVAGRTSGPVFLADRAPTRPVPSGDLDPVSGRARAVLPARRPPVPAGDRVDTAPAPPLGADPRGRGRHQHPHAARPLPACLGPLPGALRPAQPRGGRPPRRRAGPGRPAPT
jgi:integrase